MGRLDKIVSGTRVEKKLAMAELAVDIYLSGIAGGMDIDYESSLKEAENLVDFLRRAVQRQDTDTRDRTLTREEWEAETGG